jgi:hypothetical protein
MGRGDVLDPLRVKGLDKLKHAHRTCQRLLACSRLLGMWKDVAFSLRTLRRSPLFSAVAVLSLALGIGANTAIFSLLDQVTLRSLPVSDPQRLMVLHTEYNGPGSSTSDSNESVFSYPMYRDLRDRDPAFRGVIARMGAGVTLARQGAAEQASAEMVTGNFFRILGVGAAMGRVIAPEDDGAPGANPVVVLSHSYFPAQKSDLEFSPGGH